MSFSKTYPLPHPAETAARIAALGGPKLDPAQPSGTITEQGVELGYSIAGGEITLTLLHKPWAVPQAVIEGKLDSFFGVKEGV